MLGHLGINVPDLEQARSYYAGLLPALRYEPFLDNDDEFAWRPAEGRRGTYLFFYPSEEPGDYSRRRTGLQHLAFIVPTRSAVAQARQIAAGLGSEIVHEPRDWPDYPPPYHACFWLDPFGLMIEAVCHHDRG